LHPLIDEPEKHLKINEKGELQAINNSEKGDMTIKICNLNRNALWLDERKKIIDAFFKKIHELLNNIFTWLIDNNLEKNAQPEKLVLLFKSDFEKIKTNMKWEAKFSRVYFSIYQEFELFLEKSNINKGLVTDEKEFLLKIFKHYKQTELQ